MARLKTKIVPLSLPLSSTARACWAPAAHALPLPTRLSTQGAQRQACPARPGVVALREEWAGPRESRAERRETGPTDASSVGTSSAHSNRSGPRPDPRRPDLVRPGGRLAGGIRACPGKPGPWPPGQGRPSPVSPQTEREGGSLSPSRGFERPRGSAISRPPAPSPLLGHPAPNPTPRSGRQGGEPAPWARNWRVRDLHPPRLRPATAQARAQLIRKLTSPSSSHRPPSLPRTQTRTQARTRHKCDDQQARGHPGPGGGPGGNAE